MNRKIKGLLIVVLLGAIMIFAKNIFADGSPKELPAVSAAIVEKIEGGGLPTPSVRDISGEIGQSRDRSLLLDPRFLWKFVYSQSTDDADLNNSDFVNFNDYALLAAHWLQGP